MNPAAALCSAAIPARSRVPALARVFSPQNAKEDCHTAEAHMKYPSRYLLSLCRAARHWCTKRTWVDSDKLFCSVLLRVPHGTWCLRMKCGAGDLARLPAMKHVSWPYLKFHYSQHTVVTHSSNFRY